MINASQQKIIEQIHHYVTEKLQNDRSGHDIAHVERVVKIATHIQKTEPHTDLFIIKVSAYLHDVIDDKVVESSELAKEDMIKLMTQLAIDDKTQEAILTIIDNMSFRKNITSKQPLSDEGKIVQDADRIDAIGAIGIGRAFYYGGHKRHMMHNSAQLPRANMTELDYRQPNTIINHFYEKLFLLKAEINTTEGRRLAENRHRMLIEFVSQFKKEWNGLVE